MKPMGTNTAHRTSAMATIGPLTSSIAFRVASLGVSPSAMLRSTFSTTTMASSTTMPMASTSPNRDRALMEKPSACITAKVPTSDTGTAAMGMIDARQVWRKRITTRTTRASASRRVRTTSSIDARTNRVGS